MKKFLRKYIRKHQMDTIKTKKVSTEVFQDGKNAWRVKKKPCKNKNHVRSKMSMGYDVKYHKDRAVIESIKLARRTKLTEIFW